MRTLLQGGWSIQSCQSRITLGRSRVDMADA
jgi:hypothetical protein